MEYVLINQSILPKEEAHININDRGYHFGDGIYEVIRIYEQKPFALDLHLSRLASSAEKLDLPLPCPLEELKVLLLALVEKNSINNGTIYFQVTRGVAPRNHLYSRETKSTLTAFTQELASDKQLEDGIQVWLTPDIRWLRCDIKTINLLGNVLAKREAADNQCQEAIMHRDRILTEGSSSNLFLVKDHVLYTHPATNLILNGITRQIVIQLAKNDGIDVIEEPFPFDVLEHADEAFITSTSMEITPINQVKGELTTTIPLGPVTKRLRNLFTNQH